MDVYTGLIFVIVNYASVHTDGPAGISVAGHIHVFLGVYGQERYNMGSTMFCFLVFSALSC